MTAEFLTPTSLPEALDELAREGAVAVAGGTQIGLLLRQGLLEAERLVWLGRIAELAGIRDEGAALVVGAGTTLAEIAASPLVGALHPMLAAAAALVGNPRVRAVATLGGHLAHADPRQDLPPVLLALESSVVARGPGSRREIALRDLFVGPFETRLAPDELLTEVRLPAPPPGRRSRYLRFTPNSESDYATVGVAAAIDVADGRVAAVRLGLCGVSPRPLVLDLTAPPGEPFGPRIRRIATEAVAEACDPVADQRGSIGYKREMAVLWTGRLLQQLFGPDPDRSS